MIEFKKTGVAAAVAGALLAVSGVAQAFTLASGHNEIILSAPDDVMLVPHVICNRQAALADTVNTLVGLTTIFPNRDRITTAQDFRPERQSRKPTTGVFTGKVHWRWYNVRSEHKLDGIIDVTDNDFVRFDWCSILDRSGKLAELNGQPGYLLFHADAIKFNTANNVLIGDGLWQTSGGYRYKTNPSYELCAVSREGCTLPKWQSLDWRGAAGPFDASVLRLTGYNAIDPSTGLTVVPATPGYNFDQRIWLYGHSYLIQGDWASQAFIPILSAPIWDAVVRSGYPAIERLVRGIDYTNYSAALMYQDIVMRYFLDPALSRGNSMVFWFNSNQGAVANNDLTRCVEAIPGIRNRVPLETFDSEQVYQYSYTTCLPNELNVITSTPTAPAFPGMIHTETESGGATVVNTGLVNIYVPQVNSTVEWLSSGVAFNLLALGAGANPSQIQTEMATAGADLVGPF